MRASSKAPIPIFLVIVRVIFVAELVLGMFAPILKNRLITFNLFQLIEWGLYAYALLCAHGYIKHVAAIHENGVTEYDTNVPLLPIVAIRLLQFIYYFWRKRPELDIRWFIVLVLVDIFFIVFLLIDKSSYYYESEDVEEM